MLDGEIIPDEYTLFVPFSLADGTLDPSLPTSSDSTDVWYPPSWLFALPGLAELDVYYVAVGPEGQSHRAGGLLRRGSGV